MGSYPELKGKAAIVTGGGGGICHSCARLLAEEGVDVAVVEKDRGLGEAVEKQLQGLGTNSFYILADVSVPADVEAACKEAMRRLGRVDILINCAGGFPKVTPVTEYSLADWDAIINSNLRSTFLFTQLVLPGMVARRWGRIVSISSGQGQSVPYLTSAIYAAAKAGVLGFTRHVAAEVAKYGVTVNATAPGLTRSPRIARIYDQGMGADRLKTIPMGRMAEPDEQANAVVFLCSDRASYITGETIGVNGGMIMI